MSSLDKSIFIFKNQAVSTKNFLAAKIFGKVYFYRSKFIQIKMVRIILFLSLYFLFFSESRGQTPYVSEFGKPTPEEFSMTVYEKDTTAKVVILHEQASFDYKASGKGLVLIKNVYKKIKVFDSQNFDRLVETIPLIASSEHAETLRGFRGYVHTGSLKHILKKENLLPSFVEGLGTAINVLVSNVEDGSIIEYVYRIESPFLFNLRGWNFQNEIPTLYSELLTKIPVGFSFNQALYGNEKLYLHDAGWSQDCIQNTNRGYIFRCPVERYAMKDIPAFRKEEFMLSAENYLSRIEFEPEKFLTIGRKTHHISTDWNAVDKRFQKDELFGRQLRNSKYLKKHLPDSILSISNDLEKAKALYYFIQSHYKWNGMFYSYGSPVKEVFNAKEGSATEINVSLINALQAAGLDAKLMMISTRENGLPTIHHPVMTKFNYTIVHLTIDGETYLLDATDKDLQFGILPFYALNVQGRLMDFKKGSSWSPITPYKNNFYLVQSSSKAQTDGSFEGNISYSSSGYIALEKRKTLKEIDQQEYINEKSYTEDSRYFTDFVFDKGTHAEDPFKEEHKISFSPEESEDGLSIKAFVNNHFFEENPFESEERLYPIDFGHPFSIMYQNTIDLGNEYTVSQLPENRMIRLAGDDGQCGITYQMDGNILYVNFQFRLNEYRFQPDAYPAIKQFFEFALQAMTEDVIELKKNS